MREKLNTFQKDLYKSFLNKTVLIVTAQIREGQDLHSISKRN